MRIGSKHHQLLRILARLSATLIGEVNNITILPIRKIQDLHIAGFGQVSFDVTHPRREGLLSVHETRVD